jgi:hypothetical protein
MFSTKRKIMRSLRAMAASSSGSALKSRGREFSAFSWSLIKLIMQENRSDYRSSESIEGKIRT